ncbi:GNAT family N-acetyltransferase [Bacillus thuringiensis]|nr:GNAT family N-acetyltransferase [Bacillus thuringiensis]
MNFEKVILNKDNNEMVNMAYSIYHSNPEYFQIVSGRTPTREELIKDIEQTPPNTNSEQKKYCLLFVDKAPIGILDYVENYPDKGIFYIGLFMIDGAMHEKKYGSKLYHLIETTIKEKGYQKIRLGVVHNNNKAFMFWTSVGFEHINTVETSNQSDSNWIVKVMEKKL